MKHPKILEWENKKDAGCGDRHLVTLDYGWSFTMPSQGAQHVRGFYTVREARAALNNDTYPCDCMRCKFLLAERNSRDE